jgi:hypothetical protein
VEGTEAAGKAEEWAEVRGAVGRAVGTEGTVAARGARAVRAAAAAAEIAPHPKA